MKGFRDFVLRGNIVDLAVAVIIGVAFGRVVTSFTNDLINPLIGLFGGRPNLTSLTFGAGKATFKYGAFLTELISFLITAAIVYFFVVLPVHRLLQRLRPAEHADTKECPECLSTIPAAAIRCAHCTVALQQPSPGR
jgi:large conductance mechanosensitive channel